MAIVTSGAYSHDLVLAKFAEMYANPHPTREHDGGTDRSDTDEQQYYPAYWYDLGLRYNQYLFESIIDGGNPSETRTQDLIQRHVHPTFTFRLVNEALPKLTNWAADENLVMVEKAVKVNIEGNEEPVDEMQQDEVLKSIRERINRNFVKEYMMSLLINGVAVVDMSFGTYPRVINARVSRVLRNHRFVAFEEDREWGDIFSLIMSVHGDTEMLREVLGLGDEEEIDFQNPDIEAKLATDATLVLGQYEEDGQYYEFFLVPSHPHMSGYRKMNKPSILHQVWQTDSTAAHEGIGDICAPYELMKVRLDRTFIEETLAAMRKGILIDGNTIEAKQLDKLYNRQFIMVKPNGTLKDAVADLPMQIDSMQHYQNTLQIYEDAVRSATSITRTMMPSVAPTGTATEAAINYSEHNEKMREMVEEFAPIICAAYERVAMLIHFIDMRFKYSENPLDSERQLEGSKVMLDVFQNQLTLDPAGENTGMNYGKAIRDTLMVMTRKYKLPASLISKNWPMNMADSEQLREEFLRNKVEMQRMEMQKAKSEEHGMVLAGKGELAKGLAAVDAEQNKQLDIIAKERAAEIQQQIDVYTTGKEHELKQGDQLIKLVELLGKFENPDAALMQAQQALGEIEQSVKNNRPEIPQGGSQPIRTTLNPDSVAYQQEFRQQVFDELKDEPEVQTPQEPSEEEDNPPSSL